MFSSCAGMAYDAGQSRHVSRAIFDVQGIGIGSRIVIAHSSSEEQKLDTRVYDVPADIDQEVARLKLAAMKIAIDELTAEQQDYLSSWEEGT